jgi:hypothetical protein
MKYLLFISLILLSLTSNAQDVNLYSVLKQDIFISKSCANCNSNKVIPIKVPANTVFLYFAMSINDNDYIKNIELLQQIQYLISKNPIRILGDLKPLIPLITGCQKGPKVNFHVETDGHVASEVHFKQGKGFVCDYSKCQIDFAGGPFGFQVIQRPNEDTFYVNIENTADNKDVFIKLEIVAVTRDY